MSSQFPEENVVGNDAKCLTEVKVDHIHSLSLIHPERQFVIEGDQVRQAGPAFYKSMPTGPDHLVALQVPRDDTLDNALHELPWH